MLLATFRLEHDAFALEEAFEAVPEMTVEAERIAAHSMEWTMPCLWVAHDDYDAVDEALGNDPSIESIIETDEFDGEKYYHVDWREEVDSLVEEYIDKEGSILEARANGADGWHLRMRFVTREQFDTFRERLSERGHSFTLEELTEPGSPRQSFGRLTAAQREALVAAREAGYYDVPREATAQVVAEELDMSHQALSELLRRATGKLVDSMLTTEHKATR